MDRLAAMDYLAGVIEPDERLCDPHEVTWGEERELLTLDFACRTFLDWDVDVLRAEAFRRIRAVSPVHVRLLDEAIRRAS